jgi:hypothetical protein
MQPLKLSCGPGELEIQRVARLRNQPWVDAASGLRETNASTPTVHSSGTKPGGLVGAAGGRRSTRPASTLHQSSSQIRSKKFLKGAVQVWIY